jgi:threonine dehydrogenase-like Zn-dependent dehydrogenase
MFGDAFDKGLTFKMGQTHVQRYLPELLEHIESGALNPDAIITHRMSLEEAVEGYRIFDKKEEDCRKVILVPGFDSRVSE